MRASYNRDKDKTLVDVLKKGIPILIVREGRQKDKLDLTRMANLIGVSRQSLWATIIQKNSISADNARKLIEQPFCSLTADDILPYIR